MTASMVEELVPPAIREIVGLDLDRPAAELDVQMEECLKFLTLASERTTSFIPLVREVDEVWHAFIVQTRFYFDLCDRLPGHRYIHHGTFSLHEYTEGKGRRAVVRELIDWVPTYVKRFGPFTEERARYWAVCTFLTDEIGLTLEQVNELGTHA
jgi:hypothetical protein